MRARRAQPSTRCFPTESRKYSVTIIPVIVTQIAEFSDLGIGPPGRIRRLVSAAVDRLDLQLRGMCVLTEAGSGSYALTPAIALAAGADEVIAVSRDSEYGTAASNLAAAATAATHVTSSARRLSPLVGRPSSEAVGRADIITNLGFVRPIDESLLSHAKRTAVVALMCEAWEWRDGDVDLALCRTLGIPVLGTNENAAPVNVFRFCGPLAGKLLFEAGIEICGCRIVVFSPDRFGPVIANWLTQVGALVWLTAELQSEESRDRLAEADVLLLADYGRSSSVIDDGGLIECSELARVAPTISVVQFAGGANVARLEEHGISVYPRPSAPPRRMARTLAHLGPRPVIDLHAAGLKVGELACRARRAGLEREQLEASLAGESSLCQPIL